MKYAVIDATHTSKAAEGMAGTWLRWELSRRKAAVTAPESADVLLCSLNSMVMLPTLRNRLKKAKNPKARVVIGGAACYSPVSFEHLGDAMCVGEGQRFMRVLLEDGWRAACELPEAWIPGDTRTVIPSIDFPWDLPPIERNDGQIQVFASRGCKSSCLFCAEGWAADYSVNPNLPKIERFCDRLRRQGKAYMVGSNDAAHDGLSLLKGVKAASVSLKAVQRAIAAGMIGPKRIKVVRIGVEGVSERMRKACGKACSDDELIETTAELLARRVNVIYFFVVGMPCERDEDYEALQAYITRMQSTISRGNIMCMFHSFDPHPSTPMGIFGLEDEYYARFMRVFYWWARGPGYTARVALRKPAGVQTRLKSAKLYMGATEEQLYEGWFERNNPNWRIQYRKPPSTLRRIATNYQKRYGGAP